MASAAEPRLRKNDAAASLVVFTLGLGGLFLLDVLLSARLDDDKLADWALTRSLVLFGAVFCLLGIDQALLRGPAPIHQIAGPVLVQACVMAAVPSAIAWLAPNDVAPAAIYLSVVSLTFLAAVSGINRATFRITSSHASFHLWKLVFAGVALWAVSTSFRVEWALALVLSAWAAASWAIERRAAVTSELDRYRSLLPVGARFWASGLVAGGLAYADQIVLNFTSDSGNAASYFRHAATFLPLALFATGFLANLINPYLRQIGDSVRANWKRLARIFGVLVLGLVVSSAAVGGLINFLFATLQAADSALIYLILALAGLRIAYLGPSAVVGVFGSRKDLDSMLVGTVASIPVLAVTYVSTHYWMELRAAVALAASLVAASSLRLLWSMHIAHKLLTRDYPLELKL